MSSHGVKTNRRVDAGEVVEVTHEIFKIPHLGGSNMLQVKVNDGMRAYETGEFQDGSGLCQERRL